MMNIKWCGMLPVMELSLKAKGLQLSNSLEAALHISVVVFTAPSNVAVRPESKATQT